MTKFKLVKNKPIVYKTKKGFTRPIEPSHPYTIKFGERPVLHMDKNGPDPGGLGRRLVRLFNVGLKVIAAKAI